MHAQSETLLSLALELEWQVKQKAIYCGLRIINILRGAGHYT
jgi:hypothetical protein